MTRIEFLKIRVSGYLRNSFLLLLCFKTFLKRIFVKESEKPSRKFPNILVMTTGKIGDIVCTTPFLRELKKGKPNSKVSVMMYGMNKSLLKFNPNIDEIIEIDDYLKNLNFLKLIKVIKSKNFDWSFNLFLGPITNVIPYLADIENRAIIIGGGLTIMDRISIPLNNHRLFHKKRTLFLDAQLRALEFLGIKTSNRKKELWLNEDIENRINKFLDGKEINASDQRNFVVSVTAGVEFKEWILNRFAALVDKLIERYNAKIIFIGTEKDKEKVGVAMGLMKHPAIDLSGLLTLEELPYLLKRASLFIGGDIGPLYIANALDKPVVDILGPIDMYSQPPIYEKCEVVVKNIYCQPCGFTPKATHKCREGHHRCIEETTVDDVLGAVGRIMEKYNL